MITTTAIRRAGMTLVELLVVVAVIGLLAITVLPTLATTADSRRTREAARIVSSYVARAQSRAIGRTEWAGFWLVPPDSNSSASFAIDLYLADVPAVFRGNSTTSTVSGTGSATAFMITSGSLGGPTVSGTLGDVVRFDGQPPWYSFISTQSVGLRNGGNQSENVNQNPLTTPWPAAGVSHTYELLRRPIRVGSPLSLAAGRCVDLRWSGYGGHDQATYLSQTFGPASGSIAVLFDGTGRLRQLFYGNNRVSVSGPVYMLVGRSDRAGNAPANLSSSDDSLGANWQYPDSFWLAIDPLSGIAKTAECKKQSGLITDDVFSSQEFIRSEIVAGGR